MRPYALNPSNYESINQAGCIVTGVGLQSVTTVNCLFGSSGNASYDLDRIFANLGTVAT